jgi:hypothetical protein
MQTTEKQILEKIKKARGGSLFFADKFCVCRQSLYHKNIVPLLSQIITKFATKNNN